MSPDANSPDSLRFGTAGIPSFLKNISTWEGIEIAAKLGLDCFELELVKSNWLTGDIAQRIKQTATNFGIKLSLHASYFINLNSPEEGKRLASSERLLSAARWAEKCGAESVVFHCGYYGQRSPQESFQSIKNSLQEIVSILKVENSPVILRPETMGRRSQFGTVEEILFLCREVERLQPCLDFSHIHAREGKINSYAEFTRILVKVEKKLGQQALKNLHLHLAGVDYNEQGEIRHINLEESDFHFDEWIQALKDMKVEGTIICESPDQARDALLLKKLYLGQLKPEEKKFFEVQFSQD
ncbi:MAG: hypothetical protein B5M54_05135 [Candidatus Aminicenantes bacterium 4484_214]|nr:MAG: hypothetical protein B5M54_05135 [Candidatus Aminicenantes bacterium 4484_214]RLE09136.1 MAG: hypothetical protein DRJ06_03440 [Candidatus Aminicenantes bacterium]